MPHPSKAHVQSLEGGGGFSQAWLQGNQVLDPDALLASHRSYLNMLLPLITASSPVIKGLAHITGGGFIENIPRMLPEGLGARIDVGSWPLPSLFKLAQQRG